VSVRIGLMDMILLIPLVIAEGRIEAESRDRFFNGAPLRPKHLLPSCCIRSGQACPGGTMDISRWQARVSLRRTGAATGPLPPRCPSRRDGGISRFDPFLRPAGARPQGTIPGVSLADSLYPRLISVVPPGQAPHLCSAASAIRKIRVALGLCSPPPRPFAWSGKPAAPTCFPQPAYRENPTESH
jgi:hypothetical protein